MMMYQMVKWVFFEGGDGLRCLFPGELLVTEGQLLLDDSKKIRIVRN